MNIARYNAHITAWLRKPPVIIGIVLAVLVGGWMIFGGDENAGVETIPVVREDFVTQVIVSGTVIAASDVELGFTQSGRVAGVYAKPGERVSAGKLLANIENGELRAAVLQSEAAYEVQKAKLAALERGTRPEQLAITESSVMSAKTALAQAHQSVIDAMEEAFITSEDAIRNQADQFISNARLNPKLNLTLTNDQYRINIESERGALEAILTSWQSSKANFTPDHAADVSAVQSNLSRISSFLSLTSAALNTAVPTQSVSQANISEYIGDISSARSSVNSVSSALTNALTTWRAAEASLTTAERNLALEKAGTAQEDIDAQKAQLKAAEADVVAARAQLQKTLIVAPFSGIVARVDIHPGEIVSPNTPSIALIGTGTFQIESYVPEVNIADVHVGDSASTTLDAYGVDAVFPATVVSIEPAETVRDGVSTYKTVLQFRSEDERIRSGMTANIIIETGRIEDTIVIPRGAVVEKNGTRYVEVLMGEERLRKTVELGPQSLGRVEVKTGLTEGESLILNPNR